MKFYHCGFKPNVGAWNYCSGRLVCGRCMAPWIMLTEGCKEKYEAEFDCDNCEHRFKCFTHKIDEESQLHPQLAYDRVSLPFAKIVEW